MNKQDEEQIQKFEETLTQWRMLLWGLYLYQGVKPKFLRWLEGISYRRMHARTHACIKRATALLARVREGKAPVQELVDFRWLPLPTTSLKSRITVMLTMYATEFKDRDLGPLSKSEFLYLRRRLKQYL